MLPYVCRWRNRKIPEGFWQAGNQQEDWFVESYRCSESSLHRCKTDRKGWNYIFGKHHQDWHTVYSELLAIFVTKVFFHSYVFLYDLIVAWIKLNNHIVGRFFFLSIIHPEGVKLSRFTDCSSRRRMKKGKFLETLCFPHECEKLKFHHIF